MTLWLSVATVTLQLCPRSINSLWIPKDLVPDVMAANSSLSQLDNATLFCFFAQQLRTPPPRVTTPLLVDLREVLSEAQSAPVQHKRISGRGS